MFNKIRKRAVRKLICRLDDLFDCYDLQAKVKRDTSHDNTYEVYVAIGIKKAIQEAYKELFEYR